jgi:hypothetical protein
LGNFQSSPQNYTRKTFSLSDAVYGAQGASLSTIISNFTQNLTTVSDVNARLATKYDGIDKPDPTEAPKPAWEKGLPESIVNDYSLLQYRGPYLSPGVSGKDLANAYSDYFSRNPGGQKLVPPEYLGNPTARQIIDFFSDGQNNARTSFSPADFIYCKYYQKIPNNQMIVLRRFPNPVSDNIYNGQRMYLKKKDGSNATASAQISSNDVDKVSIQSKGVDIYVPDEQLRNRINSILSSQAGADGLDQEIKDLIDMSQAVQSAKASTTDPGGVPEGLGLASLSQPDIARAITYFGEATGNKMEEILKFTYGLNWKDQTADIYTQQISSSNTASAETTPLYQKMGKFQFLADALTGNSPQGKLAARISRETGANSIDYVGTTMQNYVLGPINVIDKNTIRDRGLNFDQKFTITFEYELRSFNMVNPRVAMMDIMANLLVLTYNRANFWGGAHRFYGSSGYNAEPFGDYSKLQKGDYMGFFNSVKGTIQKKLSNDFGINIKGGKITPANGDWTKTFLNAASKLINQALGNFLGDIATSAFGSGPAPIVMPALISGAPHGDWHLTLGNPIYPIAMIGNLNLKSSTLSFVGPLGKDDFPSGLKLEVELAHGKPRDRDDFESMFNGGTGRLYATGKSYDPKTTTSTPSTGSPANKQISQPSSPLRGGNAGNSAASALLKFANGRGSAQDLQTLQRATTQQIIQATRSAQEAGGAAQSKAVQAYSRYQPSAKQGQESALLALDAVRLNVSS